MFIEDISHHLSMFTVYELSAHSQSECRTARTLFALNETFIDLQSLVGLQ